MRNLITGIKKALVVISFAALAACNSPGSTGGDDMFVGVWKNSGQHPKTLTVQKVDSTYKVVEVFSGGKNGDFAQLEASLNAKDNYTLVAQNGGRTKVVLSADGKSLTSFMRALPDSSFVKVN